MLFRNRELAGNLTNYDVAAQGTMPEWTMKQTKYVIQRTDGHHILIMGKQFASLGEGVYDLVLVRDISQIYDDIQDQIWMLLTIRRYQGT